MALLEEWQRREYIICHVEGGYWGRDELYRARNQQRRRWSQELEEIEQRHSGHQTEGEGA